MEKRNKVSAISVGSSAAQQHQPRGSS